MLSEFIEIVVIPRSWSRCSAATTCRMTDADRLSGGATWSPARQRRGPAGRHVAVKTFIVGCFQIQVRWTLPRQATTS
jgi:hypothetical protein